MANEGHSDETLIRATGTDAKCVVFAGNGAIENGWSPLRAALDSLLKSDTSVNKAVTSLRTRNEEAFHQLAIFSYKFKIARGLLFTGWAKSKKKEPGFLGIDQTHAKGLPGAIKTFLKLRKDLSDFFLNPSFKLSLRTDDEIKNLIGPDAHFVTTNWDNTLWDDKAFPNLVHFRGRAGLPGSLVFPTELLVEDAAYDMAALYTEAELRAYNLSKEYIEGVISTFRAANIESLLAAHSQASKWVSQANKIVIWGYSLGDYDADVNAMIATYTSADVAQLELIVIDPDFRAFHRAIALTGITNALHYNPLTKTKVKFVV